MLIADKDLKRPISRKGWSLKQWLHLASLLDDYCSFYLTTGWITKLVEGLELSVGKFIATPYRWRISNDNWATKRHSIAIDIKVNVRASIKEEVVYKSAEICINHYRYGKSVMLVKPKFLYKEFNWITEAVRLLLGCHLLATLQNFGNWGRQLAEMK